MWHRSILFCAPSEQRTKSPQTHRAYEQLSYPVAGTEGYTNPP